MRVSILALFALAAGTAGCSPFSVAKIGYKTIRGVKADVIPLAPIPAGALAPYEAIQVGKVTTDVPEICPPPLLAEVETKLAEAFAERLSKLFPGGTRSLAVDVVCRYYKRKSRIGKEGRLDLLVHLRDAETSRPIGRFFVEGLSESALHTGMDDMAEGVAKEVAKYLKKLKAQDEEQGLEAPPEPSTQPADAAGPSGTPTNDTN